ncbi:MAG: hypothetical protein ACXVV5_28490 [Solirubrobacteraceae bacterium]
MARIELDGAVARTCAAGSSRCRLLTDVGVCFGEIDFARGESHWWSEDEDARGGRAMEAIYVGGRCYWATRACWREIRVVGEDRRPGIGDLTESSERLPIAPVRPMEAGSPTGFVVVGEVMTRRVGVRVSLDDDGRITRVEADYAPLIDPEDAEVIVPGLRDTYGLYDFGAEVSMPEPSVCDVVEVSEEFSAGLSAAGG